MKQALFSKSLKIFASVFLSALFAASTSAQSLRSVKGQVLTSTESPKIRLKFDKKFKFAGSQEFVLYDRARAEQYFFVEAEGKQIKRLFMLQFEGYLPKIDARYDYNEPRLAEIGGLSYFSNSETVPDVEAALKAVTDSDIARAARFLQEKGFVLMKSLRFQRFVRVVDEAKRNEFIILYVEDAPKADSADLQSKALANFKALK